MELLVVLVLLALAATMVIPRITGQERRAFDLAVDGVADLLTMYAQRDALATRSAGIWHDVERNSIVLGLLDIDEFNPDAPAEWRPDPHVSPVRLPPAIPPEGVSAWAGGDPVDFTRWPIATRSGRDRETVEIELRSDDGHVQTLVLASHAVAPHHLNDELRTVGPIDLDAAGRNREDW